jgi:hypothetical protein
MSTFARNLQDRALTITRALPTADGTVTSTDFDLGPNSYEFLTENFELVIDVPALTATHLPNADTLTVTVQSGNSASPTTTLNLVKVITGTGSAIAAQTIRFRLPSNTGRYVNVKFVAAGGTGDISGVTATLTLRF